MRRSRMLWSFFVMWALWAALLYAGHGHLRAESMPPRENLGRLAFWLGCRETASMPQPSRIEELSRYIDAYRIKVLYFNVGSVDEKGDWIPCGAPEQLSVYEKNARYFYSEIRKRHSDVYLLGWLNACTTYDPAHCVRDGEQRPIVDYTNENVQRNMLQTVEFLISPTGVGLDGVHVDIEPVPNGEETFIQLVSDFRALTQSYGKVLSIAGQSLNFHDAQITGPEAGWSPAYIRRLAAFVDDVVLMSYAPPRYAFESSLSPSEVYQRWLSEMIVQLKEVMQGSPSAFHVGVPAFKDRTEWFNPEHYNLRTSLPAIVSTLCQLSDTNRFKSRLSIAVYGEWHMNTGDWETLEAKWVRRQSCARGANPSSATGGETSTVLVMDVSGSMNDPDGKGQAKIIGAKEAAATIINQIKEENVFEERSGLGGTRHQVGLIVFNDVARVVSPLSLDFDGLLYNVSALTADGGTNIGEALDLGINALAPVSVGQKIIILLSDGLPTVGIQTAQEFIDGPLRRARATGVCIYTVGLGEVGEMNADLLRLIADESGCGDFYLARDAFQLVTTYIRAHLNSVAEEVEEWSGDIRQGEEKEVGVYRVPQGQETLDVTLLWPGSKLSVKLRDPDGVFVTPGSPNAEFFQERARVRVLVRDPKSGNWTLYVKGDDVPEGKTPYVILAAVHPRPPTPTPMPTPTPTQTPTLTPTVTPSPTPTVVAPAPREGAGSAGWVLLVMSVALVGISAIVFSARRRRYTSDMWLELRLPQGIHLIRLEQGEVRLGRSRDNDVVLSDPTVSRHHAVIRRVGRGYVIQDLNSQAGTWVNGQRLLQSPLRPGDRVQIGRFVFIVRSGAYPGSR